VIFSVNTLPPREDFVEYQKINPTRMIRITGVFKVATKHGVVECEDGYLAIDDTGYPYPVAKDVFERSYRPLAEAEFAESGA
jgi:hypothetical protein